MGINHSSIVFSIDMDKEQENISLSLLLQSLEDDFDNEEGMDNSDDEQEATGLLGGMSASGILRRTGLKSMRRKILRRLSLALAIYGLVVMVVCLITNTFFIVAH